VSTPRPRKIEMTPELRRVVDEFICHAAVDPAITEAIARKATQIKLRRDQESR
jgi:hypothetical protein